MSQPMINSSRWAIKGPAWPDASQGFAELI